jgi:uncharacterized iron-regulated membrane protein
LPASKGKRFKEGAVRKLVWFHRWLGIATCLIFALWFASGAVLLFEPFPSLGREEQMALQEPVMAGSVGVGPSRAAAAAGGRADSLRLVQRAGMPAYVAMTDTGSLVIDARDGRRLDRLTPAEAARVARRIDAGGTATPESFDYDQWVVHNRFDPLRPFYRLDLADAAGTRLYLSAVTGEIVLRTTRWQRGWNWTGAVLHWAYFTPLRSSFTTWDRSVWWLSFVALLVAVAGTILGIVRTLAAQRQRKPALTYFRSRWLRWHHLLGLFASVFVLTWIFSGWLSMDHGRLFSRGTMTPKQVTAYAGGTMADRLRGATGSTVHVGAGAKELEFSVVAGRPVLTVWSDTGPRVFDSNGAPIPVSAVDELVAHGITGAWPGKVSGRAVAVPATDTYALAEGWPVTARLIQGDGRSRPDVVFDGVTGRVLTVNDGSRKAYAWVYYVLHTFKFPGLAERPGLRQAFVLIPLLLGFLFSITGVVIGWQRLRTSGRLERSQSAKSASPLRNVQN